MFKFLGAVATTALLAACASGADSAYSGSNGKTLIVEPNVWSTYQEYAAHINGTNPGTFIVVIDGDHAVSSAYGYCPDSNCRSSTFTNKVFRECKDQGLTCAIFARSSSIVLNYKLAE